MQTILDLLALGELKAATEGAKKVGTHVQDPFGSTKDLFDDVHKKKMEYELAKQNLIHETSGTKAVLDKVSQIHNLDQAPVSMHTQPMQPMPNPMDTQQGFVPDPTNDPLAVDPAMGQPVNQGKMNQQLDPASRIPQNMAQTPGQMNQKRPSQAGFQPGVSPGPAESVRPQKMGMPQPGQANVSQKAGFPAGRPNPQKEQFSPAAPKPNGAQQLPGAQGPGDAKVQNQIKKAQSNSNSKTSVGKSNGNGKSNGKSNGNSNGTQILKGKEVHIKIQGNQDCMKGSRQNLDAMTGLDAIRSCNDGKMKAYGTSEGVQKAWDSRGRGGSSAERSDQPAYKTEKQDGKWVVMRRGEVASPGMRTRREAEEHLQKRMDADLRYLAKSGRLNRPLDAYGTSEGVQRGWDTRGRSNGNQTPAWMRSGKDFAKVAQQEAPAIEKARQEEIDKYDAYKQRMGLKAKKAKMKAAVRPTPGFIGNTGSPRSMPSGGGQVGRVGRTMLSNKKR